MIAGCHSELVHRANGIPVFDCAIAVLILAFGSQRSKAFAVRHEISKHGQIVVIKVAVPSHWPAREDEQNDQRIQRKVVIRAPFRFLALFPAQ